MAGLILVSALLFWVGHKNPFVIDASNKIQYNADVRSHQFQWETFFNAYSADQAKGSHLRNDPSRPVVYFCYWLLFKIDDGKPWPFHLLSLIFHAGSAFLVGLLLLKLLASPVAAVEASFLFLLLPLNIGVAFYPYALSDVIATFFTLLILYLSFKPASWWRDGIASLAFILACFSKQSAVIIPALVFVVNSRARRMLAVLMALAVAYLILRFAQFGRLGDMEAENTFEALDYFSAQGVMIVKYFKQLMLPSGLSLDHWIKLSDFSLVVKILAWLGVAAATIASVWQWRKNWNWLAAGWLLFLIPLLPVSSFLPTTDLFAERRAYLSSVGFLLMFAGGILRTREKQAMYFAALWVAIYGYTSFERVHKYSKAENVYKEALALYPGDARNLGNLATLDMEAGRFNEAFENLQAALKLEPNNLEAMANLAVIHQIPEAGRFDLNQADLLYSRVLQLDPTHVNSLQNMGYLKLSQNQPERAIEFFTRALQLSPRAATVLVGMGRAEEMRRNIPAAIQYFEAALKEEPTHPVALQALSALRSQR